MKENTEEYLGFPEMIRRFKKETRKAMEESYLEGAIDMLKIMEKKYPEEEGIRKVIDEFREMKKEIGEELDELEDPFMEDNMGKEEG